MADVTDATFERDVIVRSQEVAVVVDLWAPWCGPCRTLGPILEKVIAATGGKIELVKVNIDENPQVSNAFQVQSIPAVFGLRDGKVVGTFVGAQPEAAVQQFVDSLLPSEAESEVERLLQAGDEASLRAVLDAEPDRAEAVVALAELLVEGGRGSEAIELLERIPESSDTRRVAALARVGAVGGDAGGDVGGRLDELLERVKGDDAARQEFVDLLEVMGADDPRIPAYRKALTARLF
ncbi:MAG: thioredoxin [Acidimicrobiia bacterium]|nr:thioredoxin [Acidimicrobiia bacterium]